MFELPTEPKASDPAPGAAWYAKLFRYLRSLRISVAPGCGLSLTPGWAGGVLAYDPGPLPRFAVSAQSIDGYNASTKKLGVGKATPHRISVTVSGWYLVPVGGPNIDVGNADPVAVAANRVLQLKIIDGVPIIDVDYCQTSGGSTGSVDPPPYPSDPDGSTDPSTPADEQGAT